MADDLVTPILSETAEAEAAPETIGPYQKQPAELMKCINDWFAESAKGTKEQRESKRQDWKVHAGDQWAEGDKEKMEAGKRPAVTLNMVHGIVRAVEGEERSNRQEIKAFGAGADDDPTAAGFNLIFKWIDETGGGQFQLSRMFTAGAVCGEGWIVPDYDTLDDPNGIIKLMWVDEDEAFPDVLANCPVDSDARRFQRRRMMTEEEGEARWPGFREKARTRAMENGITTETDGKGYRDIYMTPNDTKSPKIYDAQKKLWSVVETWWFQIEPGWIVVDEKTGLLVDMTETEFEEARTSREEEQRVAVVAAMQQRVDAVTLMQAGVQAPTMPAAQIPPGLKATQSPIKRLYQAFSVYDELLESRPSPLKRLKRFPYVPFRVYWDKAKKDWFGVVRLITDPQRQHNVEQSVIIQLMQLMPKASWMGPKGSFHNRNEWENKIAQPGALLEYNAQRGKPEPIPVPPIPRHLIDMAFSRPEAMRAISGINIEMTGIRQGGDAGVVMEQRTKAAKSGLAGMFDNYRWTKKEVGKVLVAMIQEYITPGRKFRIMGPEGSSLYAEATADVLAGQYDVTIDETNSTVNDRIATMNLLQTTLPQMVKAGLPLIPEFIDLMPMQPHIRDAWKRQLSWQMQTTGQSPPKDWKAGDPVPDAGPPPEVQAAQMQAEIEKAKLAAQIETDRMKSASDQAIAQQQAAFDAQLAQQQMANEQRMAEMNAQIQARTAEVLAQIKAKTAIVEAGIKADTAEDVAEIQAKTAVKVAKSKPTPKPATPAKKA